MLIIQLFIGKTEAMVIATVLLGGEDLWIFNVANRISSTANSISNEKVTVMFVFSRDRPRAKTKSILCFKDSWSEIQVIYTTN